MIRLQTLNWLFEPSPENHALILVQLRAATIEAMGGVRTLSLLALGGAQLWGASAGVVERRQDVTHKFCPGGTNICFSETQVNDMTVRIAIPDVKSAPFDVLLQIVAPKATTAWASIAWGGKMANNPLTVGWASGNGVTVSSRWAT